MIPERLFKLCLSCRIDPLSYNHGFFFKRHCPRIRRDHRPAFFLGPDHRDIPAPLHRPADVLRRRPAAPAHNAGSHGDNFLHGLRKLGRIDIVDCPAALASGKPRIGVNQNRGGRNLKNLLQDSLHLHRPQPAVDSENVHPKALQKRHGGSRIAACEKLSFLIKHGCGKDRKRFPGCRRYPRLLGRQNRCLKLIAVAHGLYEDQIRSGFCSGPHHLLVDIHGVLKIQISQRL